MQTKAAPKKAAKKRGPKPEGKNIHVRALSTEEFIAMMNKEWEEFKAKNPDGTNQENLIPTNKRHATTDLQPPTLAQLVFDASVCANTKNEMLGNIERLLNNQFAYKPTFDTIPGRRETNEAKDLTIQEKLAYINCVEAGNHSILNNIYNFLIELVRLP